MINILYRSMGGKGLACHLEIFEDFSCYFNDILSSELDKFCMV
jgi:hypothetical protein